MSRNGGILSGGFNGLRAPSAPTITGVTTSIGSASVAFTAPTDTGDGAISSYVVTAVDESSGASTGVSGASSPITISPGGGTFKIRMQALNPYGPGRLTEYDTGNAIYSGAELYAWGRNNHGQLGLNSAANTSSPVQIGALSSWKVVSIGQRAASAISTDGTLWGWGAAVSVGDSTTVDRSSPVQISSDTDWASTNQGLGSGMAVKTTGSLWAWGLGGDGRLGLGNVANQSSPVQVGALTNWSVVSQGSAHAVAIKTDNTLWTWGYNNTGQLGDNTVVKKSSPIQIGVLTNWAKSAAGGQHSLAIKTNGTLWAWGDGYSGQLGNAANGFAGMRSSPIQIGSLTNWSSIGAGQQHSLAARSSGELYSFGYNGNGQLGLNDTNNRSDVTQVGALTNWSIVSGGYRSSGSIKANGTLWRWGSNDNGQLGINSTANTSSPVQVGALTAWLVLSAGGSNGRSNLALYGVV